MNHKIKQKKYQILILVLLLIITVGYAVLSSTVNIRGVSKIKDASWDIYFDNVQVNNLSVPIIAENNDRAAHILENDNTKVSFSITLDKPGDFYEFNVDAVNDGSIDAMVDTVVSKLNNQDITTLPSYLNYTVTHSNNVPIEPNHLLPSNTRETYKVRIEYKKDIDKEDVVSEEISLNFDFTINYKQADDSAVGFVNYKVIHKYQNLDLSTYSEVVENLKGIGGNTVTPNLAPKHGFISPSSETVEINSDGSTVVEYLYNRAKFRLALIDSEYIETTTPTGEYYYETPITLKAKEREDYTFDHWSNNSNTNEITFELADDTTIGPVYYKNSFLINLNANGGQVEPISITVNRGNTIGNIPTPIREGYYLFGWYTGLSDGVEVDSNYTPNADMELFARWKISVEAMIIENSDITIREGDNQDINITNKLDIQEEYSFTSSDTTVATIDNNGNIVGVGIGNATITITGLSSSKTKTIDVEVIEAINSYVVELDPNGGSVSPVSVSVTIGEEIGELPTPVYENRVFDGWWTGLLDGVEVDSSFVPDSDTRIFARWTKMLCARANTLHTEECDRTTNGCGAVGYTLDGVKGTTTITYGFVSTGNYNYGNAYNCDINDDGVYSDNDERFYYLGTKDDNAALIFYTAFEGDDGIQSQNIFDYHTGLTMMPSPSQWPGVSSRFGEKVARYPYIEEVEAACDADRNDQSFGRLDTCLYLLENTRFISDSNSRSAIWINYSEEDDKYYRIFTTNRYLQTVTLANNSAIRPVIEVPVNLINNQIEQANLVTVTFNYLDDTPIKTKTYVKNSPYGVLDIPYKINYVFEGWYSDSNFENRVYDNTTIPSDITLFAKWRKMDSVCTVGGEEFGTIQLCIDAAPNNLKTTITMIENYSGNFSLTDKKNILLDLNNYTVSTDSGTIITNGGILEIKNGYIVSNVNSSIINNNKNATLIINNAILSAEGNRQAIYNNNGLVTIKDNSFISASSDSKGAVHNYNNGTIHILGGEIVSSNYVGVYNESGTLVIGNDDEYIDKTSPIIKGYTYGVSGEEYSFYDGTIKGSYAAVESESNILIDSNVNFQYGSEEIDSVTYNTLSLKHIDYQVTYNPNGGSVNPTFVIVTTGNAIGSLPTPVRDGYYFIGWYTDLYDGVLVDEYYEPVDDVELFARWKVSIESAIISNSSMILEVGNNEDIVITNKNEIQENYTFTSSDDSIVTVDEDGNVVAVGEGVAVITITGLSSNKTKTVNVRVTTTTITYYQINLNANGGSVNPSIVNVDIGEEIGELPTPVYQNHVFEGWYTGLLDGVLVDSHYIPSGDGEIFARWKKIVCQKAVTLHTEECERTIDGCGAAGYTLDGDKKTTTITYGKVSLGTFDYGNAYNCDVNDDNIYSDLNERFYYLGHNGDNEVLMFYSNFEGEDGIATTNIFNYSTAFTKLPTTTQWSGLPVVFGDRAARFADVTEIINACGLGDDYGNKGELDNCLYLLENSRFISPNNGRTAIWLNYSESDNIYYRIHTTDRTIWIVNSSSNNAVRPVIEVPTNLINNTVTSSDLVTVTFNTDGGSSVPSRTIHRGSPIGELPTTTKEGYTFEGWYTDGSFSTLVDLNTIIDDSTVIVAKWNELSGVCLVKERDYETLSACVSACPNNTETTIKVIKNIDATTTVSSNKNIILDLNGYTLSYDDGAVITNNGRLNIKNGIITTNAGTGAINNNSTGNLVLEDLLVEAEGTRQGLYNKGGTVTIKDGCRITASSLERATVHNLSNGTMNILGGTIISYYQQAIYNESGTLVIGNDDGKFTSTKPVIQGYTYGVTGAAYSYYDGIIKGVSGAVEDELLITKDSNSQFVRGNEIIDSANYNTLSLLDINNNYEIQFNANGGTVNPTSIYINQGDPVGKLPVPENGGSTFIGWYTNLTDGIKIDENEIPNGNVTYYAKWS